MIQTEVKLNSKNYQLPPVVYMVQGDTGRELKCLFDDFILQAGMTATAWFKRPNGTNYSVQGTINVAENYVTVTGINGDQGDGALTRYGRVVAMLAISYSGAFVSSFPFIIEVIENAHSLPSTPETSADIQELRTEIDGLSVNVESISYDLETALIQIQDLRQLIDSGPAIATQYTHYQDVNDMAEDNRLIGCLYNGRFFIYTGASSGVFYFAGFGTGFSPAKVQIRCYESQEDGTTRWEQQFVDSHVPEFVQTATQYTGLSTSKTYVLKPYKNNCFEMIESQSKEYRHVATLQYDDHDPDFPTTGSVKISYKTRSHNTAAQSMTQFLTNLDEMSINDLLNAVGSISTTGNEYYIVGVTRSNSTPQRSLDAICIVKDNGSQDTEVRTIDLLTYFGSQSQWELSSESILD